MPKISEVVKATGIKNEKRILELLRSSDKYKDKISVGLMGSSSIDGDINEIAAFVKSADAARTALDEMERAEAEKAKAEYEAEVANCLITSGYSFEGYKITKYSGYISGDDAIEMPRTGLFDKTNNGQNLTNALVSIRRQALKELKEAAVDLGCNAVIGVDFDYITLDPETIKGNVHYYEPYVICVTANGNAVVIEKIEE